MLPILHSLECLKWPLTLRATLAPGATAAASAVSAQVWDAPEMGPEPPDISSAAGIGEGGRAAGGNGGGGGGSVNTLLPLDKPPSTCREKRRQVLQTLLEIQQKAPCPAENANWTVSSV